MSSLKAKPRVLVLDGDPVTMTGLAAVLDARGLEVFCARSLDAGLKAVATETIDLVVIDPERLETSAAQALDALRRISVGGEFAAILLQPPAGAAAVLPSTYYIAKPFDPNVLLELAESAVWMPHLVGSRIRGRRPARPGWVTL